MQQLQLAWMDFWLLHDLRQGALLGVYKSWYATSIKSGAGTLVSSSALQVLKNNKNNNNCSQCLLCCHMTQIISRVHPFHLMSVEQCQWLPTLRSSQPSWAVSPPAGCYCLHPPSPFIIIHPESWSSWSKLMPLHIVQDFIVPWRVEGSVDLGIQGVRKLPEVLCSGNQGGKSNPASASLVDTATSENSCLM